MEFYLILLVIAIIAFVIIGVKIKNALIAAKQMVNEAWSDVDVQLKRRHDLIPNLIDIVKEYAVHEKSVGSRNPKKIDNINYVIIL
jgi:LemA protein